MDPYRPPQDGDHPPKDGPPIPIVEIWVRCWGWACSGCGPGRRVEAFKIIKNGIEAAQAAYPSLRVAARLASFTYDPKIRDLRLAKDKPEDLKQSHADLAALKRLLLKHKMVDPASLWVTEPTKRGRIHHHVLLTGPRKIPKCSDDDRERAGLPNGGRRPPCVCSWDKPCIQRLAWSVGMGFVDVRAIGQGPKEAHRGAAYLSKYLVPDPESDVEWPRYGRRMGRSRTWGSLTFKALRQEWIEKVRALKRAQGEDADLPSGDLDWELVPHGASPLGVDRITGEVLLPSRLR